MPFFEGMCIEVIELNHNDHKIDIKIPSEQNRHPKVFENRRLFP